MRTGGGNWIKDFTTENVISGIISAVLGCTGPALLVLEGASSANLPEEQLVSWMFAIYVFGGLLSVFMPLTLKIPVTGAHSISGVAFVATVMAFHPFSEFVGAYLLSGLLMFLLAITGIFNKVMEWVPREIIAAMLAGMMLEYVTALIPAVVGLPWVGAFAVAGFILLPRLFPKLPGIFGALIFGIAALILFHPVSLPSGVHYTPPSLQAPTFSLAGFISISLPLALLVLSNDCAQGLGALKSYGFNPPVNKLMAYSGVFSMVAALFGGHCSNVAGMMTAICADPSAGPKEKRYIASAVSGFGFILFGLFSWYLIRLIAELPPDFVKILAGFSISGILLSSLQTGFSTDKYRFSALFTFVIAASDIHIYNVSSPVWALLVGSLLVKILGEGDKKPAAKAKPSSRQAEEQRLQRDGQPSVTSNAD